MKEYTVRIFTDELTVIEYHIIASNMRTAEDEALRKFKKSGVTGQIKYLNTQGPI